MSGQPPSERPLAAAAADPTAAPPREPDAPEAATGALVSTEPTLPSAQDQDPRTPCRNCGRAVTDRYCSHCGQARLLRPLSLPALILDLLVEVLDADARLRRSLRTLVLRPGQLTLDWVAGRRARHVPTFRLYLLLNVAAFLVISLQPGPIRSDAQFLIGDDDTRDQLRARIEALAEAGTVEELERRQRLESALTILEQMQDRRAFDPAQIAARRDEREAPAPTDADIAVTGAPAERNAGAGLDPQADPESELDLLGIVDWLEAMGYPRALVEARIAGLMSSPARLAETLMAQLPVIMILLLPVLATVLRLLYAFSGRPWVVHLVGLTHLHSFTFLLLLLIQGFSGIDLLMTTLGAATLGVVASWAGVLGGIAFPVYLLLWVRRLYGHGWGMGTAMAVLLLFLHAVAALAGIMLLLAATILLELMSDG